MEPFFIFGQPRPPMPPNRRYPKSPLSLEYQLLEIAETKAALTEKRFGIWDSDDDDPTPTLTLETPNIRALAEAQQQFYYDKVNTLRQLEELEECLIFWSQHTNGELTA